MMGVGVGGKTDVRRIWEESKNRGMDLLSGMFQTRRTNNTSSPLRGGINKKKQFFFGVSPKGGGGLAESKISLAEKNEIFFGKRGELSGNSVATIWTPHMPMFRSKQLPTKN